MELKPCPFCGGKAKSSNNLHTQMIEISASVVCQKCDAGIFKDDTEEAIKAWNIRTDLTKARERIAVLENALDSCSANHLKQFDKLQRYEDALKQYADEDNWSESESTDLDLDDLWIGNSSQGYAVAQEALKDD